MFGHQLPWLAARSGPRAVSNLMESAGDGIENAAGGIESAIDGLAWQDCPVADLRSAV
jgi:hypothetical protein